MNQIDNCIWLEFDPNRGYGSEPLLGQKITVDQYLTLPVIKWAADNIGPIIDRGPDSSVGGEQWYIKAKWTNIHTPKTFLIVSKKVDSKLFTDFWFRFQ